MFPKPLFHVVWQKHFNSLLTRCKKGTPFSYSLLKNLVTSTQTRSFSKHSTRFKDQPPKVTTTTSSAEFTIESTSLPHTICSQCGRATSFSNEKTQQQLQESSTPSFTDATVLAKYLGRKAARELVMNEPDKQRRFYLKLASLLVCGSLCAYAMMFYPDRMLFVIGTFVLVAMSFGA
ncbi:hypothetical protein C9374_009001 [Naegleria lovaniensis]|uniref:Transmembrane protein n=1 Tax=Naegleria lovaniensis TaxID=51637 RepID=A0AA88GK44_NAELO|nr:uncharacterized protein C9374_009001 [Naegleria lovaniensis]KAG2377916.1 hypothetical protein C9374_009001 [Naegleria lovaniensis]